MSKHKNKHKNKEHHEEKVKSSSSKFNIKDFFSNKWVRVGVIVILLFIGIFFSVYYRAYPATLPITEQWARDTMYGNVKNGISAQISKQYPNLPAENKQQLVNEQFALVLEEQGDQLDQEIKKTADYFKSRMQDDSGQTYLLAIDPYQHLRRAENIKDNGFPADEMVDGKLFNNHMFAPIGVFNFPEFHVYFIYYFFAILSFFIPTLSMMAASFWVPVFVSALAVIPAFFIAKRKAGLFGGFVAGLIVAVQPVFLGRTAGGFSDTDAYTVFFALMVVWLAIEAFNSDSIVWKIILGAVSGLFIGLFGFAWKGWWYVFDLVLAVLVAYIIYMLIKSLVNKVSIKNLWQEKALKSALIILVVFIISSAIFLQLIADRNATTAIMQPFLSSQSIKQVANADYWPNIRTTVAELNPSSVSKTVGQIGGKLLFFMASLGIILSLIDPRNLKAKDYIFLLASFIFLAIMTSNSLLTLSPLVYLIIFSIPVAVGLLLYLKNKSVVSYEFVFLLLFWFVGAVFASTKGTRFVLLLVPAFALALGISLSKLREILANIISKEFKISKIVTSIVLIILLSLLLLAPMKAAEATALREVPSMNDAWWSSLEKIKLNSSEDAIINSWWDFGHWFKYVADRAVTVDGAGQDYQLAHWMGTVLSSDTEEKAINTLRMLDCGSRLTYLTMLEAEDNDVMKSVRLTKEIIMQDRTQAKITLEQAGISSDYVEKILGYAFCEPPENYLITSEDMVSKAGVWAHFGTWDFEKSFVYITSKDRTLETAVPIMVEELGISEEEATDYYYEVQQLTSDDQANAWIAPWPNYFTTKWVSCKPASANVPNPDEESNVTLTKDYLVCPVKKLVARSGTSTTNLEQIVFDIENHENSTMSVISYDSSGLRVGAGEIKPSAFVIYSGEEKQVIEMGGSQFPYDVILDQDNNRALIVDPLLTDSLFTKLFFLEGKGVKNFEKFSDQRTVTGQRILVWKVKWN